MVAACDRADERMARFNTLAGASAQQVSALFSQNGGDEPLSKSMRDRAIKADLFAPRDPAAGRNNVRLVANALILFPVADKTPVLPDETDLLPPEPPRADDVIRGLEAYGLSVKTDDLAGGGMRLTFVRGDQDPVWHERVLDIAGDLPPCPMTSDIQFGSNLEKDVFLACLMDYLQMSEAFSEVLPDTLLQPAGALTISAADRPVMDRQWAVQPRSLPTGGESMTFALLDTGASASLIQNYPGIDLVSDPEAAGDGDGADLSPVDEGDRCNPENVLQQDSHHGPALFGAINGKAPGYTSFMPDLSVQNVRISGRCGARLSDVMEGLAWTGGMAPVLLSDNNPLWNETPADVIVLPYSAPGPCPKGLQSHIDALEARGIAIFVPAGNQSAPARNFFPGNCRNAVTIAASDRSGHLAGYSNYGQDVDLLAPGGDLGEDFDKDGWPDGVLVPLPSENCRDPMTGSRVDSCHLTLMDGTSVATLNAALEFVYVKASHPEKTTNEQLTVFFDGLAPTDPNACHGPCPDTPDGTPVQFMPGQCVRACGTARLPANGPALQPEHEQG